MELFNYVRNSGYERESPFVNDVKFHPVLKAKKSFASGILAAFMSADSNQASKPSESEYAPKSPVYSSATPTTSESSFFGLLKKKVSIYFCLFEMVFHIESLGSQNQR